MEIAEVLEDAKKFLEDVKRQKDEILKQITRYYEDYRPTKHKEQEEDRELIDSYFNLIISGVEGIIECFEGEEMAHDPDNQKEEDEEIEEKMESFRVMFEEMKEKFKEMVETCWAKWATLESIE